MNAHQNKDLIIRLIQQDLRHHQLLNGLRSSGFSTENHHLEIMEIVAQLMGYMEDEPGRLWMEVYMDYMEQTEHIQGVESAAEIITLSEQCYELLERLGRVVKAVALPF